MKSEGEVRQKLKQVLFRYQKKLVRSNFKKAPGTCQHNAEVELSTDGFVGVCMYHLDSRPRGVVCDSRIAGNEQARSCDLWEPLQDKDEIKASFRELFEDTVDLGPVAVLYPDLAALFWVLDEGTTPDDDPEDEDLDNLHTRGWNWGRWPWSKDQS